MLSSFLASTYNYHQDTMYMQPTLNIPQFAYARHPDLAATSSSTATTSSPSSTSESDAGKDMVLKQEDSSDTPPPPDSSIIKFSIDNILGIKSMPLKQESKEETDETTDGDVDVDDDSQRAGDGDCPRFPWLQCTRYKPPKLPRMKRKDGVKRRKLGRNPRVPFTQHQVAVLEEKFRRTHYLSSMDVAELSTALNLSDNRVKIWFQNRRARERRDREASQSSNIFPSKQTQPLMVPTVSWPVSHNPSSAFAHLRTAIQQSRGGFMPSAFSLYLPRSHTHTHTQEQNTSSVDSGEDRTVDKF